MTSIARTVACKALIDWEKTKSDPHLIIAKQSQCIKRSEDAAFTRELFFGVIKFKKKVDYFYRQYASIKSTDLELRQILRLGYYQLIQTPNIPDYAVVSETVDLAKQFISLHKVGFVNAVMRAYLRKPDKVKFPNPQQNPVKFLGIEYSYPDWLVKRYLNRFGYNETVDILKWGNTPPDFCFFINRYLSLENNIELQLSKSNIQFEKSELFEGYYKCFNPYKLLRSKLFQKGLIVISDPAQSISPSILAVPKGETALDLFAAPGGKTAVLAGMADRDGCIIAVDNSLKRLKILKENILRWRLNNTFIICGNVLKFASGNKFRYILADVPCSGTGTIRRNADLRWNLNEKRIKRNSEKQMLLIEQAAKMLSSKGRLVYSTCSIETEENFEIIDNFLKQNNDFRLKHLDSFKNFERQPGIYEVIPHQHKSDGAFAAVIEKK
ncbi:MAG: hypothetical protein J7K40_04890 [candidate division Zixibacteria bacterium]|nr:hypothetical protein [candidate division Zixibacteria bacterium]